MHLKCEIDPCFLMSVISAMLLIDRSMDGIIVKTELWHELPACFITLEEQEHGGSFESLTILNFLGLRCVWEPKVRPKIHASAQRGPGPNQWDWVWTCSRVVLSWTRTLADRKKSSDWIYAWSNPFREWGSMKLFWKTNVTAQWGVQERKWEHAGFLSRRSCLLHATKVWLMMIILHRWSLTNKSVCPYLFWTLIRTVFNKTIRDVARKSRQYFCWAQVRRSLTFPQVSVTFLTNIVWKKTDKNLSLFVGAFYFIPLFAFHSFRACLKTLIFHPLFWCGGQYGEWIWSSWNIFLL